MIILVALRLAGSLALAATPSPVAAHATTCAVPVPVAPFAAKVDAAETAYATFEVDTFSSSMDEAALMLPCLNAVVPADVSAHYLRMLGLQYFIGHDTMKADAVFAAARSADGAYVFPDTLLPQGHPIRTHYAAIDLASLHSAAIGAPRAGAVYFNGVSAVEGGSGTETKRLNANAPPIVAQRPAWPAIVQVVDANLAVTASALVFPTDALPAYDALPLPISVSNAVAVRKPLNPKVPLAIGTGVALIGSAAFYTRALSDAADFRSYHATDTLDQLTARQQKTNTMVYASLTVGLLAVAGGVGTVVVGKW